MGAATSKIADGELQGIRFDDIRFEAEIPFINIHQAVAIKGVNGFASEQRPKEDWSIRKSERQGVHVHRFSRFGVREVPGPIGVALVAPSG